MERGPKEGNQEKCTVEDSQESFNEVDKIVEKSKDLTPMKKEDQRHP